ncbi:GNAT family N-acetyltransferase [Streptomyces sp. IB2014 016-6]|uniref:GNAT family N-acetyltransferase n=1 Tax=Streptomyces sp. IB2014 016-6 TaxID=2517818 RepID=UPI0011C86C2E|nr:GNAT family N-acetyltransferase [Streptomyces sp. IB2014 016-6]TXL90939.1 GNAT family N-acetyltransferase [Streptomyces sp. IB2014 016-6]
MDSSAITSAWVAGWVVNRSAPAPVLEPWGYRIDVGLPGHVFRHVLPEPDEPSVRKLCETVTEPGAWLKVLAPPEWVAEWITPGWTVPDDPGHMMFHALRHSAPPAPPAGYTVETRTRDGVLRVRVTAPDGSPAARGQVAGTGDGATAVVDQVETWENHRRRGLGRLVMRTLETAAADAGATTGVLSATRDGLGLYTSLGWRLQGPLTGVVRGSDD